MGGIHKQSGGNVWAEIEEIHSQRTKKKFPHQDSAKNQVSNELVDKDRA